MTKSKEYKIAWMIKGEKTVYETSFFFYDKQEKKEFLKEMQDLGDTIVSIKKV
jgi:hypothetical protein